MKQKWENRTERCKMIGEYIAKTGCTIRQAAKEFSVSRSTIYKDVTKILPTVNENISANVAVVLMKNKKEGFMRGGMATKAKYAKMKANKNS